MPFCTKCGQEAGGRDAFCGHCGAPQAVSGGIPEILHDGETGFLVEPPTPEALAARLDVLLSAPDRLHEVAAGGHEIWKEQFTLQRYQREVLAVIGLTQTRSATGRSI